jgi:hypothetical protein
LHVARMVTVTATSVEEEATRRAPIALTLLSRIDRVIGKPVAVVHNERLHSQRTEQIVRTRDGNPSKI